MELLLLAMASALVLAATATASTTRLYLKPGRTLAQAERFYETKIDRTSGFSHSDCFPNGGVKDRGWASLSCVGDYNYQGTTYRFKITYMPLSCTNVKKVLVVSGFPPQRENGGWSPTSPFTCRHPA